MNVLLYGATGMVGQGVLRECLLSGDVTSVVSVGRTSLETKHPKLTDVVHKDTADLSGVDVEHIDACLFCLGISSAGMSEADYTRITYDLTLAVAKQLSARNADMRFIYVSGAGTDSTERGRTMWARVKGKTENALFALPFASSHMFRPGFIQPLHGIKSKTKLYRAVYALTGPITPLLKKMSPRFVTTTEIVGKAMLRVARDGGPKLLENDEINQLGA